MNPYYWFCYHLIKLLARIFFRLRVVHRERMINHGPVILAANHQSFLDPPLAGSVSDRGIYFLARRSLLNGPILGWLLPKLNVVPVDSEGGKDRTALKALIRILRAGEGTLVFPEGQRTLDGNLQPAQPGLGLVIAKTLAPVVPMRIFGAYEAWPVHEKWPRPRQVTVVVGEPIRFTREDVEAGGKEVYQALSQRVMDAIAALRME
ncbi:MAG TPA: lysophospholipid acyltransferase family protein [Chthoniobacterales bacterium]|nr:lysophospholipid acyltransferase family protein [Chthoniobacterales bacterium]